jgi:hypothetical protein
VCTRARACVCVVFYVIAKQQYRHEVLQRA